MLLRLLLFLQFAAFYTSVMMLLDGTGATWKTKISSETLQVAAANSAFKQLGLDIGAMSSNSFVSSSWAGQ